MFFFQFRDVVLPGFDNILQFTETQINWAFITANAGMSASTNPAIEPIKQRLLGYRYLAADIPPVDASGVYVLFLIEPFALPSITPGPFGVLYVGMTESSLEVRNHFAHEHSGFSTLRRSLGALLKHELQLKAIPRSAGPSKSNITNFRFPDDDERRLTRWIEDHLAYGFAPVNHDVRAVERYLIAELKPPLNLTALYDWRNPDLAMIRRLRDECRKEAALVTHSTSI